MLAIDSAIADAPDAVPRVDLHRQHVEQVRQAAARPRRSAASPGEAVEDPPRDDEVRARVVVGERQAEPAVVHGAAQTPRQEDRGRDEQRSPALAERAGRRVRSGSRGWSDARVTRDVSAR